MLTTKETAELSLRKAQLAGRTMSGGAAQRGYRKNVVALRARIAELEAKNAK